MLNRKTKGVISALLSLIMIFSVVTTGNAYVISDVSINQSAELTSTVDSKADVIVRSLTESQITAYDAVKRSGRGSGLVGFTGDYELDGASGNVSVIVEFVNQPAAVAQITAAIEKGEYINEAKAKSLAESDYTNFINGLNEMFEGASYAPNQGASAFSSGSVASVEEESGYEITSVYSDAINGVALTLPAGMVEELLTLDSVYAIYPDIMITLDPTESSFDMQESGEEALPVGMAKEREFLGINELHEQGIIGEGVTVAVIDTGVDYNHPDLQGAFGEYQGIVPDGKAILERDGIFYGRNLLITWPEYSLGHDYNDPMETSYEDWYAARDSYAEYSGSSAFYTSHGTHVSGTIAARGTTPDSALGVAPGATLVVYRVLARYGSGPTSATLTAIDLVYSDGCDVVNMSLGASTNDPYYINTIAVNNVVMAHDIVFCIAGGNYGSGGYYTIGTPGAATLAITVGNGIVLDDTDGSVILFADTDGSGQGDNPIYRIRNNGTELIQNADGSFGFETEALTTNENNEYKLVPIMSTTDPGTIGIGEAADFTGAVRVELEGNIAVVRRGQAFLDTIALAKASGAGALFIINGQGQAPVVEFTDANLPTFLTESYESGMALIEYANAHGGYVKFANLATASGQLNASSSNGPIYYSYQIKPDVVAPGTYVISTVPYYVNNPIREGNSNWDNRYDGAYSAYTGTSMASPHVAGIAALMRGYNSDWTAAEIKARMMNTAETLGVMSEAILSLNAKNLFIEKTIDQTFELTASFNPGAPEGYDTSGVRWEITGEEGIVSLSGTTGSSVTITALNYGKTEITATCRKDGKTYTAVCQVEVYLKINSFELNTSELLIVNGTSITSAQWQEDLTLRPVFDPPLPDGVGAIITWESSSVYSWQPSTGEPAAWAVARVNPNGDGTANVRGYDNSSTTFKATDDYSGSDYVVNGNGAASYSSHGRATITATATVGGKEYKAKCVVSVLPQEITTGSATAQRKIKVWAFINTENYVFPGVGETFKLETTPTTTADYYDYVLSEWTSNNESVATVDQDGTVTAVAAGSATITATYTSGISGRNPVTVECAITVPEGAGLYYNKYSVTVYHALNSTPTTANFAFGTSDSSIIILPNDEAIAAGYVYKSCGVTGYPSQSWITIPNPEYDAETGVLTVTAPTEGMAIDPAIVTVVYANEDGDEIKADVRVKFSRNLIRLSTNSLELEVGETIYLSARISNIAVNRFDPAMDWISSDPDKVSTNEFGRITALELTDEPVELIAAFYDGNGAVVYDKCLVSVVEEKTEAESFSEPLYVPTDEPEMFYVPEEAETSRFSKRSAIDRYIDIVIDTNYEAAVYNDAPASIGDTEALSLDPVRNNLFSEVPYSVYQVGAGMVNPVSAIFAVGYVTVDVNYAYRGDEDEVMYDGIGETGSYSFGASKAGLDFEKTISSTVYGENGKTFELDYSFNTAGKNVKDGTGIFALDMPSTVTIVSGGKAKFDVTMRSIGTTSDEDAGFHEGYVTLKNIEDSSEEYSLPFALYLRPATPTVNSDETFLNKPVISTGQNMQSVDFSPRSTLYYKLNWFANSMHFGIAPAGVDYTNENNWLGYASPYVYSDSSILQPGLLYSLPSAIYAAYYSIEYDEDYGLGYYDPKVLEPGLYTLVIVTMSEFGVEYAPVEFLVDNDTPELTINGTEPGNDELLIYESQNVGKITLTGNIYDEAIDIMNDLGMTFDFYNSEDDPHPNVPDQTYNYIAAKVEGQPMRFADIQPDGSFTIDLVGLKSGDTKVTFYAIDNFTVGYIPSSEYYATNGFSLESPCYMEVFGNPFAFHGTNILERNVILRHKGAGITLNSVKKALTIGETYQLRAELNEAALQAGFSQITWTSSNTNAATVNDAGLVTAVSNGTVTITATSDGANPISAECTIEVVGMSDGIRLTYGYNSILDFGHFRHPTNLTDEDSGDAIIDDSVVDWVRATEWVIRGEEVDENGNGDGYLTVTEGFVINSMAYDEAAIRNYLNGEFYNNSFSETEKSIIVPVTVDTAQYDANENIIPGTETSLDNQKLYLPWGTSMTVNGISRNSVFWSASNKVIAENSIFRNATTQFERDYNKMGMSNRPVVGWILFPARSYYMRNATTEGKAAYVDNSGYVKGSETGVKRGIVPVMKIDTSRIVFSASQNVGDDANFAGLNNSNYYLKSREGEHFKLTIQHEDPTSIGTLSGVPTQDYEIRRGADWSLSGITANWGANSTGGYSREIAFKLVTENANGEREYVRYGTGNPTVAALNTRDLEAGEYKLYIWPQKYNGWSRAWTYDVYPPTSNEAGVVYCVNLTIVDPSSNMPNGLGDGISFENGSYVYHGAMQHQGDSSTAPILWKVMGEDLYTNSIANWRDGYITIMSEYAVANKAMADTYTASAARNYLNDLGSSGFLSNFTLAEESAIPYYTVYTSTWQVLGLEMVSYESNINQRVYMPWVLTYWQAIMVSDPLEYAIYDSELFWSAGNYPLKENRIVPKKVNNLIEGNPDYALQAVTYRNGTGAAVQTRNSYVPGTFRYYDFIEAGGRVSPPGRLNGYSEDGHTTTTSRGIRPITKLNPDAIIYASRITETTADYKASGDGVDYYKLTVLGGHNGEDVGAVETGTPYWIGANYVIPGVTSSASGDGYTLAYKVVGDGANGREIVDYRGDIASSANSQDITIDMSAYYDGENYDIYLWLQKNNDINSHEAGIVTKLNTDSAVTYANILSIKTNLSALNNLVKGRTLQANALITYAEGTPSPVTITWKSSNPAIVKISDTGLITAMAPGTIMITLTVTSIYGTVKTSVFTVKVTM